MGEITKGIIELLIKVAETQSTFALLATFILIIMGLSIWFLVVLNVNRNIAYKRKNLGMIAVDQTIKNIKNTMMDHYFELAKMYLEDDYYYGMETAIMRYLVVFALEERRDRFRNRIRVNGFEKKTRAEWNKYKEDSIGEDFESITIYMDAHNHPKSVIPRRHDKASIAKFPKFPDLATWNRSILPGIYKELDDLLEYLLELACKNKFKKFFFKPVLFGVY